MKTKAEVQKIFDVLVSALRLVPENKIRYSEQGACFNAYLADIAKQLPPALYDEEFFTQIFRTAFQARSTKNYMRFYIVPHDYNPDNRLDLEVARPSFYINLDRLAQKLRNKYELPASDALLVAYNRRISTAGSMKLESNINTPLRPYYQNTPDLILGVLYAILKMIFSGILFLSALLMLALLPTTAALTSTVPAGFAFAMCLLLIMGSIGAGISACCFFPESVESLKSAYYDTFNNHITTKVDLPPLAETDPRDIEQIFTEYRFG